MNEVIGIATDLGYIFIVHQAFPEHPVREPHHPIRFRCHRSVVFLVITQPNTVVVGHWAA